MIHDVRFSGNWIHFSTNTADILRQYKPQLSLFSIIRWMHWKRANSWSLERNFNRMEVLAFSNWVDPRELLPFKQAIIVLKICRHILVPTKNFQCCSCQSNWQMLASLKSSRPICQNYFADFTMSINGDTSASRIGPKCTTKSSIDEPKQLGM